MTSNYKHKATDSLFSPQHCVLTCICVCVSRDHTVYKRTQQNTGCALVSFYRTGCLFIIHKSCCTHTTKTPSTHWVPTFKYVLYSRPVVWTRTMHCRAGAEHLHVHIKYDSKYWTNMMKILLVSFVLTTISQQTWGELWFISLLMPFLMQK